MRMHDVYTNVPFSGSASQTHPALQYKHHSPPHISSPPITHIVPPTHSPHNHPTHTSPPHPPLGRTSSASNPLSFCSKLLLPLGSISSTGAATPLRDPPRAASSAADWGMGSPGVAGGSCVGGGGKGGGGGAGGGGGEGGGGMR